MKRRGVASPDIADAPAVTFASEIATLPTSDWEGRGDHLVRSEYNPFADEWMNDQAAPPRYYSPGWPQVREDA